MRNLRWVAVVIGLIMAGALMVNAEEWSAYGPRAEGMGGAGVATADGATAHYWNPGATVKNDKAGFYLGGGVTTAAEGDIISALDKVAQTGSSIPWSTILPKIDGGGLTPAEAGQLLNFFSLSAAELNKSGQGFLVNGAGGLSFAAGNFTVFANGFAYANLDPVGDDDNLLLNTGPSAINDTITTTVLGSPTNSALAASIASDTNWIAGASNPSVQADNFVWMAEQQGSDTSDPAIQQSLIMMAQNLAGGDPSRSVNNNKTGVIVNSLVIKEIGVSYSKEFLDIIGQTLSVGANLKMMTGETNYQYLKYDNLQGTGDLMKDVTNANATKSSTTFGIDVGALVSFSDVLKGGLVIRNINTPKFSYAGKGDVELDPQARIGAALDVGMVTLAADYDLTKNKSSLLPGYESQIFALGAEVSLVGTMKLRLGTYQNLASIDPSPVMTYGLGFHLLFLDLDIAAAKANKNVTVEQSGDEIPANLGTTVALAVRF